MQKLSFKSLMSKVKPEIKKEGELKMKEFCFKSLMSKVKLLRLTLHPKRYIDTDSFQISNE